MTIIYPLIAMIFLTIIIGVQLLYCNTIAVLNTEVDIRHFRLFNSNNGVPVVEVLVISKEADG